MMKSLRRSAASILVTLLVGLPATRASDDGAVPWKAGAATVKITPERPLILLGYTDRNGPFDGVSDDISARALALEDAQGRRGVIVAADLVGFQAAIVTDVVAGRIAERTGVPRDRLIFNASHTHTGPVVSLDPNTTLNVAHPAMTLEVAEATITYTRRLQDQLVDLVGRAVADLRPARLSWATGRTNVPTSPGSRSRRGSSCCPIRTPRWTTRSPSCGWTRRRGSLGPWSSAAPATPSPRAARTPSAPTTRGTPAR